MTKEANGACNWLACHAPGIATSTLEKDDLRSLMLETGGNMMCRGRLYDIEAKHLGAGVYRVKLKEGQP